MQTQQNNKNRYFYKQVFVYYSIQMQSKENSPGPNKIILEDTIKSLFHRKSVVLLHFSSL